MSLVWSLGGMVIFAPKNSRGDINMIAHVSGHSPVVCWYVVQRYRLPYLRFVAVYSCLTVIFRFRYNLVPFSCEMTTKHAHKWCLVTRNTITTSLCTIGNVFYGGNLQLHLCNNDMCWIFLLWLQIIGYISPHNVTTMNQTHLTITQLHSTHSHITCNQ
jgi:hypothetical protein